MFLKFDLNFFDSEQTKENTEADWIFFNLNRREIGIPTRGLIVEIHIYFFKSVIGDMLILKDKTESKELQKYVWDWAMKGWGRAEASDSR